MNGWRAGPRAPASRASAAPGSTAPVPPGGRLRVKLNGEETEGVYGGLDSDGALRLLTPDGGEYRIAAGDVFFLSR